MQASGERGGHAFTGNLLPTLIYKSVIGLGCSPPVEQNALSACPSTPGVCVIPSTDEQVRGREVGCRASWAPPIQCECCSHAVFCGLFLSSLSWLGLSSAGVALGIRAGLVVVVVVVFTKLIHKILLLLK